ncbi:MAG: hypothetical protein WD404_10620 [Solirubrobacterales bacterium]
MRRVARLSAGAAAVAALGGSLLAALTLLGIDPLPHSDEGGPASAVSGATRARDAAGTAPAKPLLDPGARNAWVQLEDSLPARIGLSLAPLSGGAPRNLGALRSGHAWSTIKVPILVTLMRERSGRLNAEERARASAAVTASDNEAAAALFSAIEGSRGGSLTRASEAVESTLRLAGDLATTVSIAPPPSGAISTYGQTEWSLSAAARFFRALARDCLLDDERTGQVLELMEGVIPEQSWGLGAAGFDPQWKVAFKGGWGPDSSSTGPYLVRQSGTVRDGNAGVAVAVAAQADSGSFEAGVEAVDQVATWLAANLRLPRGHAPATC